MSKTVLIADDEQDVLDVLEKRFMNEGFTVIRAEDGREAYQLARQRHPDLVILDILMPGMDGGQVAEEMKLHPETAQIPVLFISALYAKREEKHHGHDIGGNMVFAKPYDMDELVTTARKLV